VRTIEGPQPLGVLWRRIDAAFADPLELNADSRIGTPGLVEAVRAGNLALVNALGTGVLEIRALMAFLPRICEVLTGQKLLMPNIATWWCGGAAERAAVLADPGRMVLSDALTTGLPYDAPLRGTPAAEAGVEALRRRLAAEGPALVAQEAVTLSTTPALVDGRLQPRPLSLRVFLARTAEGWQVMPGGFARVGSTSDTAAIAMQRGGQAADVWVVSDRPTPEETLLPVTDGSFQRIQLGALPSRAADNLFWLGRYAERCEDRMRVLRSVLRRLTEDAGPIHEVAALHRVLGVLTGAEAAAGRREGKPRCDGAAFWAGAAGAGC